jgi:hypothetical protein
MLLFIMVKIEDVNLQKMVVKVNFWNLKIYLSIVINLKKKDVILVEIDKHFVLIIFLQALMNVYI